MEQGFSVLEVRSMAGTSFQYHRGILDDELRKNGPCPTSAIIIELAKSALVIAQEVPSNAGRAWSITLLEDLRQAVKSNFK